MLRMLKDERGFTLIELVIIIILIGVLAGVAIPRFVNLKDEAENAKAESVQDAGKAGVTLDFAEQVLTTGTYDAGLSDGAGYVASGSTNLTEIEANFSEQPPNYPPTGAYASTCPSTTHFCWYVTAVGGASTPATIYGLYKGTKVDDL